MGINGKFYLICLLISYFLADFLFLASLKFDFLNCFCYISLQMPNVVLKKAINRAPWELRHETITLETKLGEGAFGEVYSGKFKLPTGRLVDVAIKLVAVQGFKSGTYYLELIGTFGN